MSWLWFVGLLVVAVLLIFLNSRLELTRYVMSISFGGRQSPDINTMRVLGDEVTKGAGVHPPKDPAP